ncbi:cobalamin B12-binding domain-containing protein [Paenalkalicoccus suaedae]|uniref:Cobalamin B12-binding domain-containing protein n=1 Tax=Paenalkalicoccus suaedae TaxID=2592382 RepID=A0A859FD80_9BACI|nr:B12-binding domain-containing protein [Paenalkalicoccus suaedae]QKS71313.1 cobalamin B12-binding domain-containing protein [Paenalkalicoccus suaedae]
MDISVQAFTNALLEGDHGRSLAIVQKWRESASRFHVYRDLFTPAMYEVGRRWQRNEISVAEEHLATGVCDFVLTQTEYELVKHSASIDATPKALFFTVENEAHFLGMKMVSILFRERQWNVRFMQANVPLEDLMKEVEKWRPSVIGVSFSLAYRVDELTKYLKAFAESDVEMDVLVGGRLISRYDFSSVGSLNTYFVKDLDELMTWFKTYKQTGRDVADGKSGTTSII